MAWVRLDDRFPDHPKLLDPITLVIQVRALCYSARYLTDGEIPAAAADRLVSDLTRFLTVRRGEPRSAPAVQHRLRSLLVRRMIDQRLWMLSADTSSTRYIINDYLHYNLSKAEVLEKQQKSKEFGQRGGRASARASAQAKAQAFRSVDYQPTSPLRSQKTSEERVEPVQTVDKSIPPELEDRHRPGHYKLCETHLYEKQPPCNAFASKIVNGIALCDEHLPKQDNSLLDSQPKS